MKGFSFSTAIITIMLIGCTVEHRVHHMVKADDGYEQLLKKPGVTYALPRTVIDAKFKVTRTGYKPGPLFAYAFNRQAIGAGERARLLGPLVIGLKVTKNWESLLRELEETDSELVEIAKIDKTNWKTAKNLAEELEDANYLVETLETANDLTEVLKKANDLVEELKKANDLTEELKKANDLVEELETANDLAEALKKAKVDRRKLVRFWKEVAKLACAGQTRFSLASPEIATHAEVDPENVYLVEIVSDVFDERDLSLELNAKGFLTQATSVGADKSTQVAVSVLEGIAAIAKGSFGIADSVRSREFTQTENALEELELLDKTMRMLETGASPETQEYGWWPTDADHLKALLALIAQREEQVLSLFYKKVPSSWTLMVEMRPWTPESQQKQELTSDLFDFSPLLGVVEAAPKAWVRTNLADAPKGFTSTSKKTTLEYDVTLRRLEFDVLSDVATGGAARPEDTTAGFFYRIPGNAQVLIEALTKESLNKPKERSGVWTDAMVVAQAGAVRALPKSVISQDSTISISLDAETGALLKAGVISKALDDTLIKRTGEAVGGVLEARAARRRADKAAKQDQLELLGARLGTLKSIRESMNVIMDPPPS